MADAEFNFQQCSFPSKLRILQVFLLPKHPFILRLSFLLKIPRFLPVLSKMEYIKIIQNGGSKMADASSSFLVINNVIVTSLLLFKVIYMLTTSSLQTADVSPRSSPLGDVSRGGTSATQRQKFHTDDVNQCLHNKSGSHGVPNANLFNFTFLLVDFGKALC